MTGQIRHDLLLTNISFSKVHASSFGSVCTRTNNLNPKPGSRKPSIRKPNALGWCEALHAWRFQAPHPSQSHQLRLEAVWEPKQQYDPTPAHRTPHFNPNKNTLKAEAQCTHFVDFVGCRVWGFKAQGSLSGILRVRIVCVIMYVCMYEFMCVYVHVP